MEQVHTVGLDIAKHVFQVHVARASGEVALRKMLRQRCHCRVVIVPLIACLSKPLSRHSALAAGATLHAPKTAVRTTLETGS